VTVDRQTTDRPRYGEMCNYRRNRLRCKKRFRLKASVCRCECCAVVKMNATEMDRVQLMTEKWKEAAQEVIEMLVESRDPEIFTSM